MRLRLLTLPVALTLATAPAHAGGCDDMQALCKDATQKAEQCIKHGKAEYDCPSLATVRDATCAQAKLLCAEEAKGGPTPAPPPH